MYKLFFSFLLLTSPLLSVPIQDVDAFLKENLSDEGIESTVQLHIPGFPGAYNPSIIPYQDGYLLSFRAISRFPNRDKHPFRTDTSLIGIAKLNWKWKVSEKSVQLLPISSYSSKLSLTAEDARFIKIRDRIFLLFNDVSSAQDPGYAMYLAELVEKEGGGFALKEPAKPLRYSKAISVEKNWSPFVLGDSLYVIYSDQPRVLLRIDPNTGFCQEVARSDPDYHWDFGRIRGGTPALPLDEKTFITFFHSVIPAKARKGCVYLLGAYTFQSSFPFSILNISPAPLGELTDYTQGNDFKVVFPCGLVVEEKRILVSWGKSDKEIFLTIFDRQKLLRSMNPSK